MSKAGRIVSISPKYAIPGGEVFIECEDFAVDTTEGFGCYFNEQAARIISASSKRIVAVVPDNDDDGLDDSEVKIRLASGADKSEPHLMTVGRLLADDLHLVANPAIDPKDDSIILTRSGSRGQQLPVTLFRLDKMGNLEEMPVEILNPTGIAFDRENRLHVTNRADGEVCRINNNEEAVPIASELGVATGLVFDKDNTMFVGDRGGTIYQVKGFDEPESFAVLEPSVSAYHMAIGLDEKLYVTAPGLASFDAIYTIDREGYDQIFFRGLGRPQGLAFDREGNCYVAACYRGRHGIVRISPDGVSCETFVAGMSVVGLCFTRAGELIVATGEAVYSLPLGIYGTLLD